VNIYSALSVRALHPPGKRIHVQNDKDFAKAREELKECMKDHRARLLKAQGEFSFLIPTWTRHLWDETIATCILFAIDIISKPTVWDKREYVAICAKFHFTHLLELLLSEIMLR